jgi:tetratricopeptide (TPR) repeat protein
MYKTQTLLLFILLAFSGFSNPIEELELLDSAEYYLKMSYEFRESNKHKTLSCLNKALAAFENNGSEKGLARTYSAISTWFINESQWDTSLSMAYKALKYGEALDDSLIKAAVYLNLGIINYNLRNLEKSKSFALLAYDYGNMPIKGSAISNIGLIFSFKGESDSALTYFKRANQIFETVKDTTSNLLSNIAITNINMGTISLEMGDYDNAKKYFNKSLITCYSISDHSSIILNYINFGKVFILEKNFDLAEEVIMRAHFISDSIGFPMLSNLSKYLLSELYYSKGEYKIAYETLNEHLEIKDSLRVVDIENKIANLQNKYEVEKQQQHILSLEKEKQLSNYKTFIIVLIIVFLAIIVIYYLNKRRITIKNKMHEINNKRKETQKKLEKAKSDIVYFTKLIKENNEKIECFEKEIIASNKNSEELVKKQERLRGMKILKDEDWVYYKTLFEEVYQDFYEKIVKIPNLTEGDKRQILLLKLGYTNKMSADVLGISTEGIKRARQRLAKKLNLLDASKLEDYFANI